MRLVGGNEFRLAANHIASALLLIGRQGLIRLFSTNQMLLRKPFKSAELFHSDSTFIFWGFETMFYGQKDDKTQILRGACWIRLLVVFYVLKTYFFFGFMEALDLKWILNTLRIDGMCWRCSFYFRYVINKICKFYFFARTHGC